MTDRQKAVATQEEIERWLTAVCLDYAMGLRTLEGLMWTAKRQRGSVLGIRPSLALAVAARTAVANLTNGRVTP